MTRLILTTSDSGAGHLKMTGIADRVVGMDQRLVHGPLPSDSETSTFFGSRQDVAAFQALDHWLSWISFAYAEKLGRDRPGLMEMCEEFDEIELWADPDPGRQLILLQLLNYLRPHGDILEKLSLVHADGPLAERNADELATLNAPRHKVESGHIEVAKRAWEAFGQPTPLGWATLLNEDLQFLPHLRIAVQSLLEELPAQAIGLGATEMLAVTLLDSIAQATALDIFPGDNKPNTRKVYDYWEFGSLLHQLAHCPNPVIQGLDGGSFTFEMHRDRDRLRRFMHGELVLTDLGRAIMHGSEDFARHNPIDRWWGGTHLTSERLWRWDAQTTSLVFPN